MKRIIITIISCAVIWGLTYLLWMAGNSLSWVVYIICAIFGWRVLNMIQPDLFLWMPLLGWLLYFFIKFILAACIGFFVAPFVIGKKLGATISDSF